MVERLGPGPVGRLRFTEAEEVETGMLHRYLLQLIGIGPKNTEVTAPDLDSRLEQRLGALQRESFGDHHEPVVTSDPTALSAVDLRTTLYSKALPARALFELTLLELTPAEPANRGTETRPVAPRTRATRDSAAARAPWWKP